LLVQVEVINRTDRNALHATTTKAKTNMELSREDQLTALADKGYHNGGELHRCAEENIITIVACKEHVDGNENGPEPAYYVEHFVYDKEKDLYICPEGSVLHTSGAWHLKKRSENISYRFKKYRTPDCKGCCALNTSVRVEKEAEKLKEVSTRTAWMKITKE
ncbi:MAG: IS1182 family transposase, partial [Bacteroidota bacterium]|nr:IS1182 family transposase [Bacteroidota bacterium]